LQGVGDGGRLSLTPVTEMNYRRVVFLLYYSTGNARTTSTQFLGLV
jgi:hypothetical protein